MRPGPKKCRETLVQELDGIFRQNHELMYQIAFRVTKNHHDAEEVLQKIFMRLMQSVIRGAPPEIAKMRGKAVGTVWAELCRARFQLMKLICKQEKYREAQETKHQGSSGSVLADGSQA